MTYHDIAEQGPALCQASAAMRLVVLCDHQRDWRWPSPHSFPQVLQQPELRLGQVHALDHAAYMAS